MRLKYVYIICVCVFMICVYMRLKYVYIIFEGVFMICLCVYTRLMNRSDINQPVNEIARTQPII